jgi:hypothetical protein
LVPPYTAAKKTGRGSRGQQTTAAPAHVGKAAGRLWSTPLASLRVSVATVAEATLRVVVMPSTQRWNPKEGERNFSSGSAVLIRNAVVAGLFFYSQALPTVRRWRWEKSRWPGDFCRQPWPMAVQQHPRAHSVLGLASAQSELALAMGLDVPLLELACRRKITERKGGDFGKTTRQRQKYPARESFAGMREQCALCSGAVSTRCTGERYWSTARALGRKHTVAKYLAEELFARCHGRAAASTHHR